MLSPQQLLDKLDISLPKWPQMLVWGEAVTPDQAQDIILRTDHFLTSLYEHSGGNNHQWNRWARETLGLTWVNRVLADEPEATRWRLQSAVQEHLNKALGVVETGYVHNTWASSSYVHGPYGWAHPDGTIGFCDSIGKWPSVREVLDEWALVANAFPYLSLKATLMSEPPWDVDDEPSDAESVPLVTFAVANGQAEILAERVLPPVAPPRRSITHRCRQLFTPGREQGLSDAWIVEYGKRLEPLLVAAVKAARASLATAPS